MEDTDKDKQKSVVYKKAAAEALKTGFLFGYSLNHYENHSHEELTTQGYNEDQIECANMVLAEFNTSVGAKLGRCPEELWTHHPCADCGAVVDTHKFNSFPLYGKVLCRICTDKRNIKRKCFRCGCKTDDPAESSPPIRLRLLGRYGSNENKYGYVCTWCVLALGISSTDFLRRRGGLDHEYEGLNTLIDQLRLVRRGESPDFPTVEESKKLQEEVEHFDWYFDNEQGEDFGKKWKDYHVSYTGVLWATFKEPPGPDFNPFPFTGWLVKDKDDPRKLYWICRVRIRYKESLGFLEIRDAGLLKSEIEIKNIGPRATDDEIYKLWEARKLFFKIEERFGRPSSLPNKWQDILEDYVYIWAIYHYQQWGEPGQKDIAGFYDVNRTSLFRHCKDKLKKPWPEIMSAAKRVVKPMDLRDIPSRYLRFYSIEA